MLHTKSVFGEPSINQHRRRPRIHSEKQDPTLISNNNPQDTKHHKSDLHFNGVTDVILKRFSLLKDRGNFVNIEFYSC